MTIDTGAAQHTLGHVECRACEMLWEADERISASRPFPEAAKLWLESRFLANKFDRARYVEPRTLADDRQYLQALGKFFYLLRLDQIRPGHLIEYQLERSERAGPSKVNQELSLLHRILRNAGLWDANFVRAYHPLKLRPADVPRALSPDEQTRFLAVAASRKKWQLVYWYALVALHTTLSNCEMRGLHVADVNVFEEVLQVRAEHAKNEFRVRTIPLSQDALWALDRILQRARALGAVNPQDYLFPSRVSRNLWNASQPMSESGIKRDFNAVRKAAEVPWLRHHDLRHSAITRMAEAGQPLALIMGMAGHISPRMTRHYTHVSEAAMRKAVVETFDARRTPMRPKLARKAAAG